MGMFFFIFFYVLLVMGWGGGGVCSEQGLLPRELLWKPDYYYHCIITHPTFKCRFLEYLLVFVIEFPFL